MEEIKYICVEHRVYGLPNLNSCTSMICWLIKWSNSIQFIPVVSSSTMPIQTVLLNGDAACSVVSFELRGNGNNKLSAAPILCGRKIPTFETFGLFLNSCPILDLVSAVLAIGRQSSESNHLYWSWKWKENTLEGCTMKQGKAVGQNLKTQSEIMGVVNFLC